MASRPAAESRVAAPRMDATMPTKYRIAPSILSADFARLGQEVQDVLDAGADTVHFDRSLQLVRSRGCKSGLVFNPGTPLDCLKYVMDKVDIILLMSVNPGFGGQAFIPATLDKAKEARKMIDESGYDISLQIDGGVSAKNIAEIAEAGVDMFVAGSAIFNTDDYKATIDGMREELAKVPFPGKVAA